MTEQKNEITTKEGEEVELLAYFQEHKRLLGVHLLGSDVDNFLLIDYVMGCEVETVDNS